MNESTKFPPNSSESAEAPSSGANLDVGHWLFLIIGTSMLLGAALRGNWVATLIILLMMIAGGIIITVRNIGNN
jgi:cytochrome c oxidase subunit IV